MKGLGGESTVNSGVNVFSSLKFPVVSFWSEEQGSYLTFAFHVAKVCVKWWSNLSFTEIQICIKIQTKSKNGKPALLVFLCHMLTITVDEHGINTFKLRVHVYLG